MLVQAHEVKFWFGTYHTCSYTKGSIDATTRACSGVPQGDVTVSEVDTGATYRSSFTETYSPKKRTKYSGRCPEETLGSLPSDALPADSSITCYSSELPFCFTALCQSTHSRAHYLQSLGLAPPLPSLSQCQVATAPAAPTP